MSQCNWSYLHHSKRDLNQCQLSCMVGMLTRMLKNIASSLEARGVRFIGKACLCYTLHPKAHSYPGHGTKIWTSVNQHGRPSTKGVLTLGDLTHYRLRLTPKTQFVWLVWSLCTSLGRGWLEEVGQSMVQLGSVGLDHVVWVLTTPTPAELMIRAAQLREHLWAAKVIDLLSNILCVGHSVPKTQNNNNVPVA